MPEEESGIEELIRLSRQFTRQQEEHEKQARLKQEQGKKVWGVLQGLQDLNINMALQQLKTVAGPEIIRKVNALKTKGGTDDLRKMITALADDLEKNLSVVSASKTEMTPLVNSMRTLNILLDLYFSLK
jgi:geranylgeranyl pyrophosphate synthase